MNELNAMLAICESPAEEAFARGWIYMCEDVGLECIVLDVSFLFRDSCGDRYMVSPQYALLGYRIDFMFAPLLAARRRWSGVAVEVDGHRWHERTASDAAKQRRRDRALLSAGYLTVRYAAVEVLKDPVQVAYDLHCTLSEIDYADGVYAAGVGS